MHLEQGTADVLPFKRDHFIRVINPNVEGLAWSDYGGVADQRQLGLAA
jgi:hypothetical protein